jgi:hypothetical protein
VRKLKADPAEYGYEQAAEGQEVPKREASAGQFVHRIYRLVPLTELESDAYERGGPMSGQKRPKFKEVLVSERYFEGIG